MSTPVADAIRSAAPVYSAQPAVSSPNNDASSRRCIAVRKPCGTLTILNFRFGQDPRHHLLAPESVSAKLRRRALLLIDAQDWHRCREAAAREASAKRHRHASKYRDDANAAAETFRLESDACAAELDLADSWGVVVLEGHAIFRSPDQRGSIECVRLDAKVPCEACSGAGIYAAFGPVATCKLCQGSRVSSVPAYLPACLRDAMGPQVVEDAPSWLDVPSPRSEPVDPSLQRLVDDFRFDGF